MWTALRNLFRPGTFTLAAVLALMPLFALAQAAPNWNVTLPAAPGKAVQKVTLVSGTLTIDRTFDEGTFHFAAPLKTIATISAPYLYQKNWLIDLHFTKNAAAVNKMNIGMVQTRSTNEVSLMFLNQADAAGGRAYLLSQLHH